MGQAKWSADGTDLPTVDPHTKAKHKILEEYIENLIITLYGKGRYGVTTFTFVDAFCGGGMYRDPESPEEWEGSPMRMIRAVLRGYEKSKRQYPLDVKYIFMDSEKDHLDCLKNYSLAKAGLEEIAGSENCIFEHGNFEERIDWLILSVDNRKGHSLFLLDPFGWTQVSMSSIRKINSLSGSEIIYTYMIDYIARFIELRNDSQFNNFQNILEADNYYLNANPGNLEYFGEQCYLRDESMRLFRERGNARYVFTFSLIPRGKYRVLYYLMHMSSNLTALEVVKDSFWKENTLDYEYCFEVYGYGFRSADYYQEGQLELQFDINKGSNEFCIDKLDRDVGRLIEHSEEGIRFRDISNQTMEKNPANRRHYAQYLNRRRDAVEFEVIRKGKILTESRIIFQRNDIIRSTQYKQLIFVF
jgi:three-Cys-motif partner protein